MPCRPYTRTCRRESAPSFQPSTTPPTPFILASLFLSRFRSVRRRWPAKPEPADHFSRLTKRLDLSGKISVLTLVSGDEGALTASLRVRSSPSIASHPFCFVVEIRCWIIRSRRLPPLMEQKLIRWNGLSMNFDDGIARNALWISRFLKGRLG